MSKLYFIFILILTTFSCTVYREFAIDVYKPGQVTLPSEAKNVAIFSRNFKYDSDTLQHYYKSGYILRKDKKNAQLNIDSIAVTKALQGLASGLENNSDYGNIEIFPYGVVKPHMGSKMAAFSPDLIKKLSGSAQADLLISLETFSYFYSEYSFPEFELPGNEVVTVGVWSIYDPSGMDVIERKTMIDTVFWDGYDDEMGKRQFKLPPRLAGIKIAAETAGENYAKRIVPSWQKVYRMYVVPPVEDFRVAAAYLEQGKWENAINIWEKYTPKKFGKLAINAGYNLALGYEMQDNIDKAQEWINYANMLAVQQKSKEDLKMIFLYMNVLKKRKQELQILNNVN